MNEYESSDFQKELALRKKLEERCSMSDPDYHGCGPPYPPASLYYNSMKPKYCRVDLAKALADGVDLKGLNPVRCRCVLVEYIKKPFHLAVICLPDVLAKPILTVPMDCIYEPADREQGRY